MLVERGRYGMSAQSALHVGIAWLAVSALLAVVNIGAISNSPLAYSGDTARLVLLLSPPLGADAAELIALIAVPALTLGIGMSLA
ncbi:MAG TPA: hypothetical protein DCS24_01705, partial [Erythrobacter sp.]|nr:hypothetical protein [Erythrobacter sp.]